MKVGSGGRGRGGGLYFLYGHGKKEEAHGPYFHPSSPNNSDTNSLFVGRVIINDVNIGNVGLTASTSCACLLPLKINKPTCEILVHKCIHICRIHSNVEFSKEYVVLNSIWKL